MSHSTAVGSGPVAGRAADAAGPAGEPVPGQDVQPRRPGRLTAWVRKHRAMAVAVVLLLLAVGITVAGALAGPKDSRALSANNPGPAGGQAVARILGNHGVTVRPVDDFAAAVEALSGSQDATLLLYDDGSYLNRDQLQQLRDLAGRTVAVAPSFTTVEGLDAGLHQAGIVPDGTSVLEPGCDDADALAAGPVLAPSAYLYGGGASCYPAVSSGGSSTSGAPGVVARSSTERVTVLGSEELLSNKELAQEGNAALSLRILGTTNSVIWYLPGISDFASPDTPKTLNELAPAWTGFLGPWLILVAALAMVWRGRRLGPLVFEPLPVTVKAGETAYGRARLYHDARAVDLAGRNLRAGTLVRLARHFRLGPDASAEDVARRTARYVDRPETAVLKLLDETPADEARLVQWAQELNKLEQEVAEH